MLNTHSLTEKRKEKEKRNHSVPGSHPRTILLQKLLLTTSLFLFIIFISFFKLRYVEKEEPSCTVDGNINWYGHY